MEVIFVFVFFVVCFFCMAIGMIVQGKPLKGSCGGVAVLMGNKSCEICGGNPKKCDELQQVQNKENLAYDAIKKDI